eukprot:13848907-Alexandrium_andersonii.AAC.1
MSALTDRERYFSNVDSSQRGPLPLPGLPSVLAPAPPTPHGPAPSSAAPPLPLPPHQRQSAPAPE